MMVDLEVMMGLVTALVGLALFNHINKLFYKT